MIMVWGFLRGMHTTPPAKPNSGALRTYLKKALSSLTPSIGPKIHNRQNPLFGLLKQTVTMTV